MESGLREWYCAIRETAADSRKRAALLGAYYAYVGAWLTLSTRARIGTHVFDREWDALVVLDTCRVDALREVADEYAFLDGVESVWSVGSTSGEWVAHTFDRAYADEIAETAYVTANPHSDAVLRRGNHPPQYVPAPATRPKWDTVGPDAFCELDEVWRDGRNERFDVVPPRFTTDRAVRTARETDADRLMVHYMQPHAPYIAEYVADGETNGREPLEELKRPFEAIRHGRLTREEAWDAYLDNLRLVLDEVSLFLDSVDARRVVITADHGEAFGELGFYEHPVGCPHPAVKKVPWVETTAVDSGRYEPATRNRDAAGGTDVDLEEHLSSLGYV